jgi:hypothetical protein
MVTSRYGAVGRFGGLDEPEEFRRRCSAVGVDEADEIGLTDTERLHEHSALPELGELQEADPMVGRHMSAHHVDRSIRTSIQRNDEACVGRLASGSIRTKRATDPFLLVMGGDHDV